jgi:hypothetical protein
MTTGEDLTWRQAGGAYYAETDGAIVALLYWYGSEVHYLHGPDETRAALDAATRVVIGCLDAARS